MTHFAMTDSNMSGQHSFLLVCGKVDPYIKGGSHPL